MKKKEKVIRTFKSFLFILLSLTVFFCITFVIVSQNKAKASGNNGQFNEVLAQDNYSEDGEKGVTEGFGAAKGGSHYTYDGHILFQWSSSVVFGWGDDGDDWARGLINGVSGSIYGSADNATFQFCVDRNDNNPNMGINDCEDWGKGMVSISGNGKSTGSKGNCDMTVKDDKYFSLELGSLSHDTNYAIEVYLSYKCVNGAEWATYQGHWTYNFCLKSNNSYNPTLSNGSVVANNIYYYKNNYTFTWNDGFDSYRNGNNIYLNYNGVATDNGSSYTNGAIIKSEGRHNISLTNTKGTYTYSISTILDKTAPILTVSGGNLSGNIYGKGAKLYYSYSANSEAPITVAKYTRKELTVSENGLTVGKAVESNVPFTSGKLLVNDGHYTITLTDLVGNTSTTEVMFINTAKNFNKNRILNNSYFKTNIYKVTIPYLREVTIPTVGKDGISSQYPGKYTNQKTYLFASYENALEFMSEIEIQECVIVVDETTFKYKQKNNENATANYTSIESLRDAVAKYANLNVKEYGELQFNATPYIDENSVVVLDADVVDNNTTNDLPFINGKFAYKQTTPTITINSKIYSYTTINRIAIKSTSSNTYLYNGNILSGKTFAEYVGGEAGQFDITEFDSLGNSITYTVYYDAVPPSITVNYEYYEMYIDDDIRQSRVISDTAIISSGLEIDTNFKSLSISKLYDIADTTVYARIESPSGQTTTTRDIELLKFGYENGYTEGGVYRIKIYDRSLNIFEYAFTIAGAEPTVSSYVKGTGDNKTLYIDFSNGTSYSSITHFTIYRYGSALPENGTYEEFADGKLLKTMDISQDCWSYSFLLGGVYTIRFTDSFGRVTVSDEIVFAKGLPAYTLTGVTENGKTNKSVSLTFKNTIGYEMSLDGNIVSGYGSTVTDGTRIDIPANAANNGEWDIKLYIKSDSMTYLNVRFIIDTIPPVATVKNQNNEQLAWGSCLNEQFEITWNTSENISKVKYSIDNGYAKTYSLGSFLTVDGVYNFTVTDDVGNTTTYAIELDTTVDYSITYSGTNYADGNIHFVKNGFTVIDNENLTISVFRDDEEIISKFNSLYSVEGEYRIEIIDYIGNMQVVNIVIDQTPPSLSIVKTGNEYEPVKAIIDVYDTYTFKVVFNQKIIDVEIADVVGFSKWGDYQITLTDALGNSITESFSIKKQPPTVLLYDIDGTAIENGSSINKSFYASWNDVNATARVIINGNASKPYNQQSLLADEGTYTLIVTDEAGNKVNVSVTIIKAIKYTFYDISNNSLDITVIDNEEYTNKPFTLSFESDDLSVNTKKDGIDYSYITGQQISIDGIYYFYIYDNLGNAEERTITLDQTPPTVELQRDNDTTLPVTVIVASEDVELVVMTFNGATSSVSNLVKESQYSFSEWGNYSIKFTDYLNNSTTVNFAINKVPPIIVIQTISGNILNDNSISNEPVIINSSEAGLVIKYRVANGYSQVYKQDDVLNQQGLYSISVSDLAGNSITRTFTIDSQVLFAVVADGNTIKDYSNTIVVQRYFEISIGEALTVVCDYNNTDIEFTDTVFRITNEGNYKFFLSDAAGNTQVVTFLIDRTAPKVNIDTEEITKDDVVFYVDDLNDVSTYNIKKDGLTIQKYILMKSNTFTEEGTYSITVQDVLGNKKVVEFSIVRTVEYSLSIPNGFISNSVVVLKVKDLTTNITVFKNGENYEFEKNAEILFDKTGSYSIKLVDKLGNEKTLSFDIDETKYRKTFEYNIPNNSKISLFKDGKKVDVEEYIEENKIKISADGEYILTLNNDGVSCSYNFIIDTLPPTLFVNGKEYKSGDTIEPFKEDFTLKLNKKSAIIRIYFNGNEIDYNANEEYSTPGHYKVVITDYVGNEITFEFDRQYTFNSSSIILIVVVLLLIAVVVIFIIRRRIKSKVV